MDFLHDHSMTCTQPPRSGLVQWELTGPALLSRSRTTARRQRCCCFQRHGLGTELLKRLLEVAHAEGLNRVTADILAENRQMIEICRQLAFQLHYAGNSVVKAELPPRAP